MTTRRLDELDSVISLGAGVQSSAVALMLANGDLDLTGVDARAVRKLKAGPELSIAAAIRPPRLALFADTGWEPAAVYSHLGRLEQALAAAPNPIEVIRVSAGDIRADLEARINGEAGRFVNLPVFMATPAGRGTLRRQCTREYKLDPMRRELAARGYGPRNPVATIVGISLDELQRVKPGQGWQHRAHPLIERRLTRHDCALYLERNGFAGTPKSSCIGCPYHSNASWRDLRDNSPEEWAQAIEVDELIRNGLPGLNGAAYLHSSLTPLADLDLATREDAGQLDLFAAECEGACGV